MNAEDSDDTVWNRMFESRLQRFSVAPRFFLNRSTESETVGTKETLSLLLGFHQEHSHLPSL